MNRYVNVMNEIRRMDVRVRVIYGARRRTPRVSLNFLESFFISEIFDFLFSFL